MTETTVEPGTMPLADHLGEVRRRLVRATVALTVGIVVGFLLSDEILDVLRDPVSRIAESRNSSLNYETVTGAFDLRLRIALHAGLVFSSPVWIAELFGFVTPGLTRRERRRVHGFAAAAIPLFVAGCAFGFVVFPVVVETLTGFASTSDSTILTASYYVDFVMKLVVAVGLAFVLPVVVVMLNVLGLLPAARIRRGWRVAVVLITLFSALVTPAADVFSMFLIAAPMSILFLGAVVVAHLHERRLRRRCVAGQDPAADAPPRREVDSCSV